MPTDRGQLGLAAGNDGKIYAFGGKSLNFGDELTTVEAYDPASNTWSVKANMPTQRKSLGVVNNNGLIYANRGL